MAAEITQEFDIIDLVQPVGIVDHDRIGRAIAKGQELLKDLFDPGHIGGNDFIGQNWACIIAAGRITNAGRAAAHQDNRLMAGFLQPAQHHDRNKRPDMQAVCSTIIAHIAHHLFF